MSALDAAEILNRARAAGTVVPGFNIPYLPMMGPVVQALRDTDSFGLIAVARLEWEKFESRSLEAVAAEYGRVADARHTRLHLDHVPVIDEDNLTVDFEGIIARAIDAGYQSVMIDGSRLPLAGNVACTRTVAGMAHAAGIPVEAELGAVMGHEAGPLPPYEELFASGRGFTDPEEAGAFVRQTGVDWLSVAVGNVHGAISAARKNETKLAARLNVEHLRRIADRTRVPLVLHGGTGIPKPCILDAIRNGIAKLNIATAIRQPYEALKAQSVPKARQAVYDQVVTIVRDELNIEGNARLIRAALPVATGCAPCTVSHEPLTMNH
ncbi:MAG: class II fructose-bisphosphate aldolase [Kiritimatiellae bacterium]|nr:class II fructose-bisphosphate aldolase [Kiritimatiellia bacterium]